MSSSKCLAMDRRAACRLLHTRTLNAGVILSIPIKSKANSGVAGQSCLMMEEIKYRTSFQKGRSMVHV